MVRRPESLITRSVCTCSGISAVSCAKASINSINRCKALAARPASAFPATAHDMPARVLTGDRAMSDVPRPASGHQYPRWRIHHTLKGRVVVAVGNQAQIRERIFDFLGVRRIASRRKYGTAYLPATVLLPVHATGRCCGREWRARRAPTVVLRVLMRLTTKRASSSSLKAQ